MGVRTRREMYYAKKRFFFSLCGYCVKVGGTWWLVGNLKIFITRLRIAWLSQGAQAPRVW
jgi:hypothetical protein